MDSFTSNGKELTFDIVRGDDRSGIGKCLMILLDEAQVVEVVDHQALTLTDAFRRCIAEPVQPLQPCAITQMEARDRVNRLSARGLRMNVVECREVEDDRTQRAAHIRIEIPVLFFQRSQGGRIGVVVLSDADKT
jgi:hypothetical protein